MSTTSSTDTSVELAERGEEWVVLVREEGVVVEKSFSTRNFALYFAEGQRIRLGLKTVRHGSTPSAA
jgi:hypothetical protein